MDKYLVEIAVKNAVKESFANLKTVTEIEPCSNDPCQILRLAISSELSAITLYTSLADMAEGELIKKVLLDVIKEEKTHVAEFEAILNKIDAEQNQENINGMKEVEKMI